jgi:hypothetical protein
MLTQRTARRLAPFEGLTLIFSLVAAAAVIHAAALACEASSSKTLRRTVERSVWGHLLIPHQQ